ncbi:MAG: AMP-binding protein [Xanthobacteraceae bacterium]
MLTERVFRTQTVFGNRLPRCARTHCDLDFSDDVCVQFLLHILCRGGTIFLPGRSIEDVVSTFLDLKVEAVVAVPPGLARYLQFFEQHGSLRGSLDTILCVGGPLSPALSKRVRARLSPNLIAAYGWAETGTAAAAPAHAIADVPGAAGFVTPGLSVEAVDDSGKALPPGTAGRLRIRGPYVLANYWDAATAGGALRDGWFYPGERGSVSADNLLVLAKPDSGAGP